MHFGGDNVVIEEWLVAKAKRGDKKSFEEIYSMIYKDLYRYAYYMLGHKEDATDAVSDTICDVYKSLKSLKNNDAFVSWVLKILSNKCKMKRKEYLNKSEEYSDSVVQEEDENEPDNKKIGKFEDDTYTRVDLQNALNNISEEDREIIILSAVYGYNSKEIGELKNMKSSSVRSRLSRALDKLKERMVAYEI
jgi:RNA polymerase sigma-70 factor (ECF subfamily)